jgi:hypothetical protein
MPVEKSFPGIDATRLSGHPPRGHLASGGFTGLARLSLGVALLSMLPACLVEDPPPFTEPKQTPPRLDYAGATPLLDEIIVANNNDFIKFTIPVTSEDAGEGLTALLFLDYATGPQSEFIAISNLPPSTLDDPNERVFSFTWKVKRLTAGCHRFIVRAGHTTTMMDPNNVVNTADLAEAYWWANIDVAAQDANQLTDCPIASRGDEE